MTKYKIIRAWVWDVIDSASNINDNTEINDVSMLREKLSMICDYAIASIILLNVTSVILSTVDSFYTRYNSIIVPFEIICGIFFLHEYVTRVWSCIADTRFNSTFIGRIKYIVTPMAIIDIVGLLPFILSFTDVAVNLTFLRILRLIRLERYFKSMRTIGHVILRKKQLLLSSIILMLLIIIFASSGVYFLEHDAQPTVFTSIPHAAWWAVVSLTSVGYGDMYPITPMGKLFTGIIILSGLAIVGLPMAIIASGLIEHCDKERN